MKRSILKHLAVLMTAGVLLTSAGCAAPASGIAVPAPDITEPAPGEAKEEEAVRQETANDLFSIELPADLEGKYITEVTKDSISVYDKEASDAGYGGFIFQVSAYESPSEYAGGMDEKVGELTAADGTLYDIAMTYPSDVQYDYTVYTDKMPETYERLSSDAVDIVKALKGMNGGEFAWGAGTKGEDLYGEVLMKYLTAFAEEWDADRFEEEDMSPMFYSLGADSDQDIRDLTGFAYMDTNHDGIDELLVGEIAEGEWKGCVYDIYTMIDREPAHVLSGWARNRYFVLTSGMLCNEYSGGADESGCNISYIIPNSTELMPQVGLKYDGYENEEQPWFISYDFDDSTGEWTNWENVTEEEYNGRLKDFSDYERFDFIPFSEAFGEEDSYDVPEDFLQYQSGKLSFKDFDEAISCLTEGQGYAYLKLYGYDGDVLAVTELVFEADNSTNEASLYIMDKDSARCLGLVSGNGSAYPLRAEDGIIYGGDNHHYDTYFLTDAGGIVGIMAKDSVYEDEETGELGGFTREDNDFDLTVDFTGDSEEFQALLAEREKKPVIEFTAIGKN